MTRKRKEGALWYVMCAYYLIAVLQSLLAYPFWHLDALYPLIFYTFGTILFAVAGANYFSYRHRAIVAWAFIAMLFGIHANLNGHIEWFVKLFPFFTFVFLKEEYKLKLFVFLRKVLVWIVGISLAAWCLHLVGIDTPSIPDVYGWSDRREDFQYIFENHFVFVLNLRLEEYILNRFSAIFLEPGYFGCLVATLLFIDEFRFRKISNIVLGAALFFTFSLAGWLVFLIAYLIFKFQKSRNRIFNILLSLGSIALFFAFFQNYNDGDNGVNKMIIQRLQYDEEKHNIEGYNRTQEEFDDWFSRDFIPSTDVFFGNPQRYEALFSESINVGWKFYVAAYGIVGLLTYLFYLFRVIREYRRSYLNYCLMLIYILIFMRGHLMNFSVAFMIVYYAGIMIHAGTLPPKNHFRPSRPTQAFETIEEKP